MSRLLALVLIVASSLAMAGGDKTPLLVDAGWLDANLNRNNLVVLDVRSGIDNGGDRSSFQKAHIPGSVYSSYTGDGWQEAGMTVATGTRHGISTKVRSRRE